jgi:hypothetical protein
MGYSTLVRGSVKKAFNLLKDLAVDVIMTSKSNTGFDFSTNSVGTVALSSKTIKAIPVSKTIRATAELPSSIQNSFLFKAEDFQEPNIYSTITVIGGSTWTIVPPFNNDGYTVSVNVVRES